ncbi:thiamine pyrophosphate-dependent enzyme [Roseateles sp.]|uniref:thiamine pyrophosphate-dependent enzyme n=1 Tax=Roseateles sp. TaxID=1971397 RepID=UPI0039EADB02
MRNGQSLRWCRERYSHLQREHARLARAFGWRAERVDAPRGLDSALTRCLDADGPFFLDVRVTPTESCFPMIPAGAGHHEVLLGR